MYVRRGLLKMCPSERTTPTATLFALPSNPIARVCPGCFTGDFVMAHE